MSVEWLNSAGLVEMLGKHVVRHRNNVSEISYPSIFRWDWNFRERRDRFLLRLLEAYPGSVLSYGEDPEEPELNGWEKLGVHSWIVPNNVPTNRLFDSLAYGGWALYQSQPRCELANDLMWKLISGSGEMKINTPDFKATISFILMSNLDNDPWTLRVAGA